MERILERLGPELESELRFADEIWIAIALINSSGLNLIKENIPTACIQNYIIGIDLPSEPKALKRLYEEEAIGLSKTKIFHQKEFFHPKVYLIRKKDDFVGFLGSANCTQGGMMRNIELSVKIDSPEMCKQILIWFEKIEKLARPLTIGFLNKYESDYRRKKEYKKETEKVTKKEKISVRKEFELMQKEKDKFLKILKKYRKSKSYSIEKTNRELVVEKLRGTIDYPNFKNIDVDTFFSIWELGHIIPLPKPTIKREIEKFSRLLIMLCDENINISERYNNAFKEEYKIRGVSDALISKVLTIHNPKKYYVKNGKSKKALLKYGIKIPKAMSVGEEYKLTANFLKEICEITNIDDLAILDYYLYLEGGEKE